MPKQRSKNRMTQKLSDEVLIILGMRKHIEQIFRIFLRSLTVDPPVDNSGRLHFFRTQEQILLLQSSLFSP